MIFKRGGMSISPPGYVPAEECTRNEEEPEVDGTRFSDPITVTVFSVRGLNCNFEKTEYLVVGAEFGVNAFRYLGSTCKTQIISLSMKCELK